MPAQTFVTSREDQGQTLAATIRRRLALSWSQARHLIESHQVRIAGATSTDPVRRLKPGERVEVGPPPRQSKPRPRPAKRLTSRPEQRLDVVLRFVDDHIVIVDKPPELTTMRHPAEAAEFGRRAKRFLPPTLADLLPGLMAKDGQRPRVMAVHRLDKETSGLLVFARTSEAVTALGRQFRAHSIERRYLAVVRGRPTVERIESVLVRDRGDGRRGSGPAGATGQRAVTHVRILEELGAYTLVECRLETGRTHQVRIHLGEHGMPLCGEKIYDRPLHGKPLPDNSGSPRIALHAARLGLRHPATGQWQEWESPPPADLAELLERLRRDSSRRRR